MTRKIKRVYVDTSVIGGRFNARLAEQTKPFWDAVERGEVVVIISDTVEQEIEHENTPQRVRDFLDSLLKSQAVRVMAAREADDLAERYVAENVVDKSSLVDCTHVALATLSQADAIVSWNLKHMVKRSSGYKKVNKMLDYPEIDILTPEKFMEAQHDET